MDGDVEKYDEEGHLAYADWLVPEGYGYTEGEAFADLLAKLGYREVKAGE